MRQTALVSLAIHAALVAALVLYGTPRPLEDPEGEPPGIPVMFSAGGGGDEAGRETAQAPPEAAAATQEARGEAPAEQAEAGREAAPEAAPAREQPQQPPPPRAAEAPSPEPAELAARPIPLPPPPPPEPPETAERPERQAAEPAPSTPSARGATEGRPGAEAEDEGERAVAGAAALLLATRDATVGRRVDPVVPVEARRARMQGTVVLVVTISPEGIPTAVDVHRSSGHFLLDRAAQEALWQWRFDPARRGGVPVEDRIAVPFAFRITD